MPPAGPPPDGNEDEQGGRPGSRGAALRTAFPPRGSSQPTSTSQLISEVARLCRVSSVDLAAALRRLAPDHPVATALRPGPGLTAPVAPTLALREVHGAIEVRGRIAGPREASGAELLRLEFELDTLALHTMRGGRFEAAYPPDAFQPRVRIPHPRLAFPWREVHTTITFGSRNGRSSDETLPFFLVSDASGRAGLWIAVGCSGSWQAQLVKHQDVALHTLVVSGPSGTLVVGKDEVVDLPRVIVGVYDGDGWDAVRRFLAANAPRRITPPVVYNTWFNENADISEEIVAADLAVAADLGVEVFVIDAGWYRDMGTGMEFETAGIGTWAEDLDKFPRGLAAFTESVRRAGLVPGLWIEPERAHPASSVAREHPEWMRGAEGETLHVVDLGVPAARRWVVELVCSLVERLDLGWLKWDFNPHDLVPYWQGNARAELDYSRGLYAALDEVLARCPDLIVESCASGGNRIDVETLQRSHSLWVSDQTISPDMVRATLCNASRVLPAQYRYLSLSPQVAGDDGPWPEEWLTGVMTGVFGIMTRLRTTPPQRREQLRAAIARYKSLRDLLDGTPRRFHTGDEPFGWDCLEFSRDGDAVLFAWRQAATCGRRTIDGTRRWDVELDPWGASATVARGEATW